MLYAEGGTDSKLFVQDLLDAYIKYGRTLGLRNEILAQEEGHAIVKFCGNQVWEAFQHESGKHCIQRVPPTEHNGRRHTSFVSVAVLPLPPESKEQPLLEKDLDVITQTGKQKAGGQNANKVASAVRMRHIPTGMTVFINGRDQGQNKKQALRILTARVNAAKRETIEAAYSSLKGNQLRDGSRGNKVRTYNFIESRAVDHRLGTKTSNVRDVIYKGHFALLTQPAPTLDHRHPAQ